MVARLRASRAVQFVLVIGIMSFFADFAYDGARSIIGPYLALLGAGAAGVGQMVPATHRASAYGLFTGGYGIFWFLGSAVIGLVYTVSLPIVIAFCLAAELAALPFFVLVRTSVRHSAS